MSREAAIWHDVECGGYEADLPLWRELAGRYPGPVLDVGAGTGRVALALAEDGHRVTALDNDPELLDALLERLDDDLAVEVNCADARSFTSGERFGLVVVPMQTIQLFGGDTGRRRFLARAREALSPGGAIAIAVADMSPGDVSLPATFPADVMSVGDSVYASRPVCVAREGGTVTIERERSKTVAAGRDERSVYSLRIDDVDAGTVEREARLEGLGPIGRETIPASGGYLGAEVILLGA